MERGRGVVWRVGEGVYGEWVRACMVSGRRGVWKGREGSMERGRGVYGEWASECMEWASDVWRVGEWVYGEWVR